MKTIKSIIDSYTELLQKIEQISEKLAALQNQDQEKSKWLTNEEVCESLKVTSRTMQNYRDNGMIGYSKVGGRIHYKAEDVDQFLESHYRKPYQIGRRGESC